MSDQYPPYGQNQNPYGQPPLWAPWYGIPFPQAFLRFWQKYVRFDGRASRSEFWIWALWYVIGNIATGNSSVVADRIGIHTGDFLLTEAGFGSDMGAERFFNLKCRVSGLSPDAAVLVATVRSLKAHSGQFSIVAGRPLPPEMLREDPDSVRAGTANLRRHIEIVRSFGIPPVVAINAFPTDHDSELAVIRDVAESEGARVAVSTHVLDGGKGATDLAAVVADACDDPHELRHTYELDDVSPDQFAVDDEQP